jgi:hypothetical protein
MTKRVDRLSAATEVQRERALCRLSPPSRQYPYIQTCCGSGKTAGALRRENTPGVVGLNGWSILQAPITSHAIPSSHRDLPLQDTASTKSYLHSVSANRLLTDSPL